MPRAQYPTTPDGRYFVVRGRLWRCSDPALPAEKRATLVRALMQARQAGAAARRANDRAGSARARAAVERAKVSLGERGAVWWTDGAPDENRRMARNTGYGAWYARWCRRAPAGA